VNSTSQNLIDTLAKDLAPVKPIWAPAKRATLWLLFCLSLSIALTLAYGELRPDYQYLLSNHPRFAAEFFMGILAAVVATYYASEMFIPGKQWSSIDKFLSISPFLAFSFMLLYSLFDPPVAPSWVGWRFGCEREIAIIGSAPMIVFLILGSRAATTENEWAGLLIGIASMTPVAAIMHLACMYDGWHMLGFHLAPVLLMSVLCVSVSKRLLKI
jgi:hypothetical protein